MRKLFDRKTGALIKKTAASLLAFVFAFVFCLAYSDGVTVNADSEVTISAVTKKTDAGPGDNSVPSNLILMRIKLNMFPLNREKICRITFLPRPRLSVF